jgi:hypothetical protein
MVALLCGWLRDASLAGKANAAGHVELDLARQFDDSFGMIAVLEQRILDGLRSIDKHSAVKAILFLRDPLAAAVLADENDSGCSRAARGRFDELHVGGPSDVEPRALMAFDEAGWRLDSCIQYLRDRI